MIWYYTNTSMSTCELLLIHFHSIAYFAQANSWWFVQGTCASNTVDMPKTFRQTQCIGNRLWTGLLVCHLAFIFSHTYMHILSHDVVACASAN